MVRVLCCPITQVDSDTVDRLYGQASPERKGRADRYRKPEDRLRCLAADGLLRYAVGPCQVRTEAEGKPYLPEHPDIHFNISHGGDWVVLACADRPVGVDVERIDRRVDRSAIAARHFTAAEQTHLLIHPEDFFSIWTAKESYLKYRGVGLTEPLNSFCVLPEQEPAGVRFDHFQPDANHCLTLCLLKEQAPAVFQFLTCHDL